MPVSRRFSFVCPNQLTLHTFFDGCRHRMIQGSHTAYFSRERFPRIQPTKLIDIHFGILDEGQYYNMACLETIHPHIIGKLFLFCFYYRCAMSIFDVDWLQWRWTWESEFPYRAQLAKTFPRKTHNQTEISYSRHTYPYLGESLLLCTCLKLIWTIDFVGRTKYRTLPF